MLDEDTAVRDLSLPVRRYLYALCEYVHALTLMQVGAMEAAVQVAKRALDVAPAAHAMREELVHLVVRGAAALEDSTTLLALSDDLTAAQWLSLAMSPAFFGGLSRRNPRLAPKSGAAMLLQPEHGVPLYMSVRQALPYYTQCAYRLFHEKRLQQAWEAISYAAGVADEVVGSLEFAFTDCFPIRVYYLGCGIGFGLMDSLSGAEVAAARRCLKDPGNETYAWQKNRIFDTHGVIITAVLARCTRWSNQIRRYFPHSCLAEVTATMVAIGKHDEQVLTRAIRLSRRYPHRVLAQNILTWALFYEMNIPEAVDAAQKNVQDYPHAEDIVATAQTMQYKRRVVYMFNYRTVLPLRYRVNVAATRLVNKRMVLALVLLLFNTLILLLTLVANLMHGKDMSESFRYLAVHMQVPTFIPFYFAVVCLVHALVVTFTPSNMVHILLEDNYFRNTAMNRFLFCMRALPLVNVSNALQITLQGNAILFGDWYANIIVYFVLILLFMPFTSRVWFISSIDEPDVGALSWMLIFFVDFVSAGIVIVPHILLAAMEPLMTVVFYFFTPAVRPRPNNASYSIHRRLIYHEQHKNDMPARFAIGSGSRFIHIRLFSLLYLHTHSDMRTRYLSESQLEEENYRAFPLIDPALVGDLSSEPLTIPAAVLASLSAPSSDQTAAAGHSSTRPFLRDASSLRRHDVSPLMSDGSGSPSDERRRPRHNWRWWPMHWFTSSWRPRSSDRDGAAVSPRRSRRMREGEKGKDGSYSAATHHRSPSRLDDDYLDPREGRACQDERPHMGRMKKKPNPYRSISDSRSNSEMDSETTTTTSASDAANTRATSLLPPTRGDGRHGLLPLHAREDSNRLPHPVSPRRRRSARGGSEAASEPDAMTALLHRGFNTPAPSRRRRLSHAASFFQTPGAVRPLAHGGMFARWRRALRRLVGRESEHRPASSSTAHGHRTTTAAAAAMTPLRGRRSRIVVPSTRRESRTPPPRRSGRGSRVVEEEEEEVSTGGTSSQTVRVLPPSGVEEAESGAAARRRREAAAVGVAEEERRMWKGAGSPRRVLSLAQPKESSAHAVAELGEAAAVDRSRMHAGEGGRRMWPRPSRGIAASMSRPWHG